MKWNQSYPMQGYFYKKGQFVIEKQLNYFTLSKANRRMSTRKPIKARKNSISRRNTKRMENHLIDERTRVIQNNLVFVYGLPFDLCDKQVLSSNIYFGRYGKVNKIFVNSLSNSRKNSVYQAYITYETELQASLTIVALDGYNLCDMPLKVSYGTTKYCSNFLKGYDCRNQECLYLHYLDEKREVPHRDSRKIFQEQNNRAFEIVCNHIEQVVDKMVLQDGKEEGFPTFGEMIKFLIDSRFVTSEQIKKLKRQRNPLKLIAVESSPPEMAKKRESSPLEIKLSKSNSFSTMATPYKQEQEIESNSQQKKTQIEQQKKSFKLEQAIEKMIIKKLLRTTQSKSKFHFVKSDKTHIGELGKLRAIVQKHLVAGN